MTNEVRETTTTVPPYRRATMDAQMTKPCRALGDKTFTYSLFDRSENGQNFQVLSIAGPAGGRWVKHWQPGQLDIDLPDAVAAADELPAATAAGSVRHSGWFDADHHVIDLRGHGAMEIAALGNYGEAWGSGRLIGNDSDNYLHNGEGDDTLDGGEGDGAVFAEGGDDRLVGEDSDDKILGCTSDDDGILIDSAARSCAGDKHYVPHHFEWRAVA